MASDINAPNSIFDHMSATAFNAVFADTTPSIIHALLFIVDGRRFVDIVLVLVETVLIIAHVLMLRMLAHDRVIIHPRSAIVIHRLAEMFCATECCIVTVNSS